MWGMGLAGILARPWARRVVGLALVALAVLLLLMNLRRLGERAGRAAERLDQMERNDAVQKQMLDAASRRPRDRDALLERLRGVGSDTLPGVCPPVVMYSPAEQTRVAEEVATMSEDAMIIEWLADYAVLRDQVQACASR